MEEKPRIAGYVRFTKKGIKWIPVKEDLKCTDQNRGQIVSLASVTLCSDNPTMVRK